MDQNKWLHMAPTDVKSITHKHCFPNSPELHHRQAECGRRQRQCSTVWCRKVQQEPPGEGRQRRGPGVEADGHRPRRWEQLTHHLQVGWLLASKQMAIMYCDTSYDKCTYCNSLWIKASAKCPKCKCLNVRTNSSYNEIKLWWNPSCFCITSDLLWFDSYIELICLPCSFSAGGHPFVSINSETGAVVLTSDLASVTKDTTLTLMALARDQGQPPLNSTGQSSK